VATLPTTTATTHLAPRSLGMEEEPDDEVGSVSLTITMRPNPYLMSVIAV
jgi:hypothetical protein